MADGSNIIVFTPGTWDMFHVGHLNLLRNARALGDKLIVGVKTDKLVYRDKGHHPLMSYEDRVAVLAACKFVDAVVPDRSLKREVLLEKLSVDILVAGDDWFERKVRGHHYMINNGKRVVYLPYTSGRSSTILRKALGRFYTEQKEQLENNPDKKIEL